MPKYHVQRSTTICANPEKVYSTVVNYGTWTSWSPWLCAEPDAQVTVTDDPSSVGSVYAWKGELVGEGEIEHSKLQPNQRIEEEIRFAKPFKSKSKVVFEFAPEGENTKVTWHMDGALPWFLFWMRSQMEVFIGMDYERGLKMLKELLETGHIKTKTTIRGVKSVPPIEVLGIRKSTVMSQIGPSMEGAIVEAKQKLCDSQISTEGEVVSVYHQFNMKSQVVDYTSGFVVPPLSGSVPQGMSHWKLPATQSLCVDHLGSYDHLGNAWGAAYQYARYKKLKQSKAGTYEIYKNDPNTTESADLLTEIYLPLR